MNISPPSSSGFINVFEQFLRVILFNAFSNRIELYTMIFPTDENWRTIPRHFHQIEIPFYLNVNSLATFVSSVPQRFPKSVFC